jgi:hypothetical protein
MTQMLLFPDPRPLVELLGLEFFRSAPESPGVYLMRDANDHVLYVGKARNLRKRLGNYRVANPDRMRRRHLKLVRAVTRIELRQCPDEAAALAAEAELLRNLRPRFNRAGTWTGPPRFLLWRTTDAALELAVRPAGELSWCSYGPLGARALPLRAVLARVLWCALHSQRGLAQMPLGWFRGLQTEILAVPSKEIDRLELEEARMRLQALFEGDWEQFAGWVRQCTSRQGHAFELAALEHDLETLEEFCPTGAANVNLH